MLKVEHWKADVEILGLGGYVVVAGSDGVGFLVLEIVVDKGRAEAAADDKPDDASAHDVVDASLLGGKRRGRPIAASTVSGLDVGSSSSLHHRIHRLQDPAKPVSSMDPWKDMARQLMRA